MDTSLRTVTTQHRFPWERHEKVLKMWKSNPPTHPENPRYRAYDFSVEGRYSMVESVVNIFREKQWLDAPPADYKWAIVTVYYKAPRDPRDVFAGMSPVRSGEGERAVERESRRKTPSESSEYETVGV